MNETQGIGASALRHTRGASPSPSASWPSSTAWSTPRTGAGAARRTLGLVAAGLILLVAFVAVERRVRNPLVPLSIFRDARRLGEHDHRAARLLRPVRRVVLHLALPAERARLQPGRCRAAPPAPHDHLRLSRATWEHASSTGSGPGSRSRSACWPRRSPSSPLAHCRWTRRYIHLWPPFVLLGLGIGLVVTAATDAIVGRYRPKTRPGWPAVSRPPPSSSEGSSAPRCAARSRRLGEQRPPSPISRHAACLTPGDAAIGARGGGRFPGVGAPAPRGTGKARRRDHGGQPCRVHDRTAHDHARCRLRRPDRRGHGSTAQVAGFPRRRGGGRTVRARRRPQKHPISRTLRCDDPGGGRIAFSVGSRGEPTNRKARRCFRWVSVCEWSTPTRT